MNPSMIKGLGTLAAALLAVLAAPASAQVSTTANGPYYATPSWDQKLPTNRFVILANWNNEALLDQETGSDIGCSVQRLESSAAEAARAGSIELVRKF